jgi:hypothetical protein
MRPGPCAASAAADAERGYILFGKDTTGALNGDFSGRWLGTQALQFVKDFEAELVPGRCVDLQVTNIRPQGAELRADIVTCQLAPLAPSWVRHAEKATPITTATTTTTETQPA